MSNRQKERPLRPINPLEDKARELGYRTFMAWNDADPVAAMAAFSEQIHQDEPIESEVVDNKDER